MPSSRALRSALGIGVVLAFAIVLGPLLVQSRPFILADAYTENVPTRVLAWKALRQGQIPGWTQGIFSGYPLLSMAQTGLGYPLTWGYALDPLLGELIFLAAPLLLIPLTTWCFARRLGCSPEAALFGGLLFTYGGFVCAPLFAGGLLSNAAIWLPLCLLAVDAARDGHAARCLAGGGAAYTLCVLNGNFQCFLYVAMIVTAYGAFLALDKAPGRWRPLAVALASIALGLGVAAPQIGETLVAVGESARASLTSAEAAQGSMPAGDLLTNLLMPGSAPSDTFPYVAMAGLLLAALAVGHGARCDGRDRRFWFFVLLVPLSFLLMMGSHAPTFPLLQRLPLVRYVRVPSRHSLDWTFALAILAAYGWDVMAGLAVRRTPPRSVALAWTAATLTAAAVWVLAPLPFLAGSLAVALTSVGALFAIVALREERLRAPLLLTVTVAAITPGAAVLFHAWFWGALQAARPPFERAATTDFLRQQAGDVGRVFTCALDWTMQAPVDTPNRGAMFGLREAAGYEPLVLARYARAMGDVNRTGVMQAPGTPPEASPFSPRNQVLDLLHVTHVVTLRGTPLSPFTSWVTPDAPLRGDTVVRWRLGDARFVPPGAPVARIEVDTAQGTSAQPVVIAAPSPGLATTTTRIPVDGDVRAVRVVSLVTRPATLRIEDVTVGEVPLTCQRDPRFTPVFTTSGASVHRNERALPRAWFVSAVATTDAQAALDRLRGARGGFDPRALALVETQDVLPAIQPPDDRTTWLLEQETETRLVFRTRAPGLSFLVTSELDYPGWHATVDGAEVPILRTDYLLRGVFVPAGEHVVAFTYPADAARRGAWVTLLSILLMASLAATSPVRYGSSCSP